ncbi:MAG TPA: response regulator [Paraburkholderia sp.]|jgi:signal transduction histidine kinase/DNA-binding response OmpR family regulator|nr:response regulator [Paraburkholderia sp.]
MSFLADHHDCSGWNGEMAERIRSFDWSSTGLGPVGQWPASLTNTVQTMLASPVPLVLLWGEEGYMVYNDAYSVFAGGRHPYLLGCPVELGWPEVADFNRHVMNTCLAGGTLSYRDKELVLLRNGNPEEVWLDLYYSPVAGDDGRPAGVLAIVVETTERVLTERWRQRAEAALHETNERLQLALNTGAVLGTWVWDIRSDRVSGDERFARTFSVPPATALAGIERERITEQIHPDDRTHLEAVTRDALTTGEPYRTEYRIRRPDGSYLWAQANGRCEFDAQGEPYRFPGVLIDIHERKVAEQALRQLTETLEQRVANALAARAAVEDQLRQAQKMEAIGGLTGGVAHDFNNVLQIIDGNLQMLASELADHPAAQRRLLAAANAVTRGAKLAAHLLAFARRQPLSPAVVNPRRLLDGMAEMLHRALGETIGIDMNLAPDLWNVLADRNQLENALLNLAINGRDAMHGEGTLRIGAHNAVLDAMHCGDGVELSPGDYVVFSVSDTGAGMPREVLEHAFEPFFTTKPDGHGTGLGLSMVFGFMKQSGGHTQIESTVGEGTTVKLYFPRCEDAESSEPATCHTTTSTGGNETVLVVEDDADVRLTVVDMLAQLGYTVLTAPNGDAALEFIHSDMPIDLLFTDVIMPGNVKSGELAKRAAAREPPVPVLFTSGHTRNEIFHHGKLDASVTLLSKPYRRDELALKVRNVIDSHRAALAAHAKQADAPAHPVETDAIRHEDAPLHSNILLVEDDAASRDALRELLGLLGLRCRAAASAEEALELLARQPYDVLLTDLTLPGMSGSELARALRRERPDLRVLLMSGYGSSSEVGAELDGLRVLPKPLDLSLLARELAGWANPSPDGAAPLPQ